MPLKTFQTTTSNVNINSYGLLLKEYTKEDYLEDEYSSLLEDLRGIEDAIASIKANRNIKDEEYRTLLLNEQQGYYINVEKRLLLHPLHYDNVEKQISIIMRCIIFAKSEITKLSLDVIRLDEFIYAYDRNPEGQHALRYNESLKETEHLNNAIIRWKSYVTKKERDLADYKYENLGFTKCQLMDLGF